MGFWRKWLGGAFLVSNQYELLQCFAVVYTVLPFEIPEGEMDEQNEKER
jgi:hypothetical protein